MNFTLHPEWRTVLFHSWSVRLQVIVGLFSAVDAAVSYAVDGRLGATAIVFGSSIATVVARVVHQTVISGPRAAEDGDDE